MLSYILLILRRQRSRGVFVGGGFLLAACALVLLSATTLTTVVQARQIIRQHWRSSYDLVVLPPQASISTNQPVPVDVFAGYKGGISIQQYERIQNLPGVAIAAPVAFIGYVQYPFTYIKAGPDPVLPGYYQLEWTQTAFDGRHQVVENHHILRFYVSPDSQNCTNTHPCIEDPTVTNARQALGVFGEWSIGLGQYEDGLPDVGTYLLAAIDPEAENALFHLKTNLTSGSMLTSQNSLNLDRVVPSISANRSSYPNYDVPLLLNTAMPGQVSLHATFVRFMTQTLDPRTLLAQKGASALDHIPQHVIFSGDVPLARNDPSIVDSGSYQVWTGHKWQARRDTSQTEDYPMNLLNFVALPSGLTYHPAAAPAGQDIASYSLIPAPTQPLNSSYVVFRPLTPLPGDTDNINTSNDNTLGIKFSFINHATFTPQVVGTFDGQRIAKEFSSTLSGLPEAAYAYPSYTLRYNTQGQPVQPTAQLPTTSTGGFAQQPPFALTTLAAAERIRGDDCISIIRVRLAGDITPDAAGLRRAAQAAQEIQQATGLRVIVTLGSSPQPVLVYVPGLKIGQDDATQNIAPLGWVRENWLAIGAGVSYLRQLGQTQTLFLGAILLVCLGYLMVTLSALVSAQRREMAVLSALGWEPWQAATSFLAQAFALAIIGGILGIGVALLIVALIGASPPWLIVAWALPIMLVLALLAALYPLWQLWRVEPAEVLRQGTGVAHSRQRAQRLRAGIAASLPSVLGMALRNLARSHLRSLIAFGSLFLSAGLLTIMIAGLFAFRQSLQGTLLGNYILLQTAVPQLAGALVAVLLTFMSVADLLLLQVRERQREIGLLHAVGWRPGVVQRLFVEEGVLLALGGSIPGVLVALGVLLVQHQASGTTPALLIGSGAFGLMVAVAALAALPAIQALKRIPLGDILRAE